MRWFCIFLTLASFGVSAAEEERFYSIEMEELAKDEICGVPPKGALTRFMLSLEASERAEARAQIRNCQAMPRNVAYVARLTQKRWDHMENWMDENIMEPLREEHSDQEVDEYHRQLKVKLQNDLLEIIQRRIGDAKN